MKKKVIRIVILLLVVGVLGTAGYYLYAKMNDPQTEALELLQQLPDKLSYNLGNNILGTADLKKNCEQNGTDVRIRLSNTEESDVAKAYLQKAFPKFQEITDLHLALDVQIDDTKKRVDMSANNEKDTIQGTAYFEGDNLQVYLPGLTNEDAIYRSEGLKENVEQEEWNQFKNDVNEFLTEQCTDMFQVASCEKIRDKSDAGEQTYELTVQTDAFADFLDECYRFVESRDEIVAFINEKIMVKDGDFLRVLRREIDEVQKQDNEYQVQVVGKDGVLVAVLMNHPVFGTLDLTFQQEEKSYNRVISYENSKNQTKVSIAIEEKNEEQYLATNTLEWHFRDKGGTLKTQETIRPDDMSVIVTASLNHIVNFTGRGYVKDLMKGKSINYCFDEFTLNAGDKNLLSGKMELSMSTLDTKLKPLEGMELPFAQLSAQMRTTVLGNLTAKGENMGVVKKAKPVQKKKANKKTKKQTKKKGKKK